MRFLCIFYCFFVLFVSLCIYICIWLCVCVCVCVCLTLYSTNLTVCCSWAQTTRDSSQLKTHLWKHTNHFCNFFTAEHKHNSAATNLHRHLSHLAKAHTHSDSTITAENQYPILQATKSKECNHRRRCALTALLQPQTDHATKMTPKT